MVASRGKDYLLYHSRKGTQNNMALVILVLAIIASSQLYECFAARVTVDLTHTYDNTTLPWPSEKSERFRFTKREKYDSPHYEANSFAVAEHGGTHLDAPRHFKAGGGSVADIPLSRLIGYTVLVNVTAQANSNRDLLINVSEFENHESKFGNIPQNSIVLLYTGISFLPFINTCNAECSFILKPMRRHLNHSIQVSQLYGLVFKLPLQIQAASLDHSHDWTPRQQFLLTLLS